MNFWIIPQLIMLLMSIPFGLIAIYLLILAVASWKNPQKGHICGLFQGKREPKHRFIILVPAHNEELLLGDVVENLRQQFYPQDYYEVVVIADNCTDRTADVARAAGATVLERHDLNNRGKGQVLHWAFHGPLHAWPRPWDAVVVVDADSILNSDFLWFMDARLNQGYHAIQGYYGVENPSDNWRTALMTMALSVFHFVRPLGRDTLGLPCGLKGNGMCFSRELVDRFGYPATSVVEDMELALIYLHNGIGVKFAPGAQVYGQMTTTRKEADSQRKRWEGGRFTLVREWALPLFLRGIATRNWAKVDAAIDLIVPPLTILVVPAVLGWCLIFSLLEVYSTWVEYLAFGIWTMTLAALLFYIAVGLLLTRAPLGVWLQLTAIPLFVIWKSAVYLRMIISQGFKGPSEWIRTGREEMR
jgi:cellulose synthase/poly-beta-1,6-N-acetylglucosamine synthase-like glycosyltransferase